MLLITTSCGSDSTSGVTEEMSQASGEGATVTNTVSSPADMKPGDIFQVLFAKGEKAVIDLNAVPSGAEFELAVMNLATSGVVGSVQMSGDLSAIAPSISADADHDHWEEGALQEAVDAHLRGMEFALAAQMPAPPSGASAAKAARSASVPAVGSTESFRVLASFSRPGAYVEVTGRVSCVTAETIFYVDVEVDRKNPADLTGGDVDSLCKGFQSALAAERALFGEPSDINGDGHVAVLLTPQVNRLGSSGGGIITGFFYANDLYPRSDANATSNAREILYIMVPDSRGVYGMTIDKEFALGNLIPAVLPHEMQHAISYHLHVLEKRGAPEESWLNEGLSHLAEDLLGYGIENPSRYAMFLQRPESAGFVGAGSPALAERGGAFLFLRYLYEQHTAGAQFVSNLLHSATTGVANIEESYASTDQSFDQFAEFFLRWSVTLDLNDRGITTDARFAYDNPTVSAAGYLQGVCTVCSPEDNRGTVLEGVKRNAYSSHAGLNLEPAAVQYYAVKDPPSQLSLWATNGSSYGAVLIRTK